MKKTYLIVLLSIIVSNLSYGQNIPFTKVNPQNVPQEFEAPIYKRVKVFKTNPNYLEILNDSGIDLYCGAIHTTDYVQLEISESEIQSLQDNGLSISVEIEDLTKYYVESFQRDYPSMVAELEADKARTQQLRSTSVRNIAITNIGQHNDSSEINFVSPQNFTIPSTFGGCLTYSGMAAEFDKMRQKYPHLISLKQNISPTNQLTHQGRPIYYVKISDNPDTNESIEPQTLYTGMTHSREVASMMNLIYYMWYVLENYEKDPFIKSLVDNSELYFVPVANPDGLVWNETITPNGGGLQRKNMRPGVNNPTGLAASTNNKIGVDLNRNFGYHFGYTDGSSNDPALDTYRGTAAFSEPETQMMRDFVLSKNFKMALNHHAYSNLMPHAINGLSTATTGREDEFAKWNHDLTQFNRYVYGPAPHILYAASGDASDWMCGGPADGSGSTGSGKNILAVSPENGSAGEGGFWPSSSTNLLNVCKRALRINFITAYYSGKYAKFHDLTQSNINGLTSNLTFGIERLGQTASNFTLTVTPVSSNIQSITSPATQTGMNKLEQRNVTASLVLKNTITANEKIEYKVSLSNGDYVLYESNYVKYYNPTVVFSHNPDSNNLTGWTASGGTWVTSTSAFSGTKSITDASTVAYANNLNQTLTTTNGYDLTSTGKVLIQYYAKWDLERNFDFVQIQGSTNGTTWTTLKGLYTKPASSTETNPHASKTATSNNFQTAQGGTGSVLYDGDTMDKWVMEEIVIDSQNNSFLIGATNAKFRFVLRTDADNRTDSYTTTFDGFYFDDFRIIKTTDNAPIAITKNVTLNLDTNGNLTVLPTDIDNGSYDDTAITSRTVSPNTFNCLHLGTTQEVTLTVMDVLGQTSSSKANVYINSTTVPATTTPAIVYHNKFNATWNPYCGASEYFLDVSTYPTFDEENLVTWSFATNTTTATTGIPGNTTKTITESATGNISYAAGVSGNAASVSGWDSGSGTKSWNINFSTTGRKNIKVSSAQFSDANGPKDFKLQYSLNNSTWVDVNGATNIVVGANYTSGLLKNVELPSACDNKSVVYLRWIMTSDISASGSTNIVTSAGISRIDDIIIKGTPNLFVAGYENLNVGNVTSYNVTGLTPNTTYYYRVRANKSPFKSTNSNITNVTTGGTPVIWNGSSWSNTTGPTATIGGIIQGNYSTATNGTFTANTLTIDSGNFVINSNTAITVVNEITNNANATNFVIQNNANLIQTNNLENSGNIIVRRNSTPMLRLDYTGWSSPVTNQNLLDFSPLTLTNRFYVYNPLTTSIGAYEVINPTTNNFLKAKGYLIRTPNNWSSTVATIYEGEFEGNPNNGRANIALGRGTTTGYNLIGNPYASTISANSFIDANISSTGTLNQRITGTLYFWTHTTPSSGSTYPFNNYATYTKLGGTPAANSTVSPNGTIQVGQAFIVNANTAGDVSFTNSMRTSNFANQFFRNVNSSNASLNETYTYRINLNIDGIQASQQLIGYTADATNDFDNGYDGELLFSTNTISFYSLLNDTKLAIQAKGLPFQLTDSIPIGFNSPVAGNFSISLAENDAFFNDKEIYIKDNLTNLYHNIKNNPFTFTTEAGEYNNRFAIYYINSALANNNPNLVDFNIYKKDTKIYINSDSVINEVEIYDTLGKLIYSNKSFNNKSIEIQNEQFKNQLLIVKINNSNNWIVKKLL